MGSTRLAAAARFVQNRTQISRRPEDQRAVAAGCRFCRTRIRPTFRLPIVHYHSSDDWAPLGRAGSFLLGEMETKGYLRCLPNKPLAYRPEVLRLRGVGGGPWFSEDAPGPSLIELLLHCAADRQVTMPFGIGHKSGKSPINCSAAIYAIGSPSQMAPAMVSPVVGAFLLATFDLDRSPCSYGARAHLVQRFCPC